MSSYLLLRNNQESGPYTIEEIQAMPLKPYDLLWVVGKSAAWRYPGEITELKSFAPPVPEQLSDLFYRRPDSKKTDQNLTEQELQPAKKSETSVSKKAESNGQRVPTGHSIYVNLPAEKKQSTKQTDRILFEPDLIAVQNIDPAYDFSNLYKRKSSKAARFSGEILWISTIVLLFGAGILTGLFISDRRKFFSIGDKPVHPAEAIQPNVLVNQKNSSSEKSAVSPSAGDLGNDELKKNASESVVPVNQPNGKLKKAVKPIVKKDSVASTPPQLSSISLNDTMKQSSLPKTDMLLEKIKAHPENYIRLEAGHYSTGVFGGISSFPVSLTNNSQAVLDLIVVSVDYIQNNGKIFKTETLSFSDVQPGETATLKAPKSPRGVRINTSMHLVTTHQPDLSSSN